eukprot:scaffold5780_cov80-Skeletonema_menzelii.AAC.3
MEVGMEVDGCVEVALFFVRRWRRIARRLARDLVDTYIRVTYSLFTLRLRAVHAHYVCLKDCMQ